MNNFFELFNQYNCNNKLNSNKYYYLHLIIDYEESILIKN